MSQVDVGDLEKLITARPELVATMALGKRIILNNAVNLGDYVPFIVCGVDEFSPEIVIKKDELVRFAKEVLEKLDTK